MKAFLFKAVRNPGLWVAGILLLLGQGCGQKTASPSQMVALPSGTLQALTETKAPAASTKQPLQAIPTTTQPQSPTTTNSPTATIPFPTSTPADRALPSQFLTRLSMGRIDLLTLSPQGDKLAIASASHICLFDTRDFAQAWCKPSELPEEFEAGGTPEMDARPVVRNISFRPDGEQIGYALWDGNIVFLESATGQRVQVMDTYYLNRIDYLVWSQDGSQMIVQSKEHGIDIWDTSSGEQKGHLNITPDQIAGVVLSPDGRILAVGLVDTGEISLWDTITYEQTGAVTFTSQGSAYDMAWSPDGNYLYADITITSTGCDGQCTHDDCWIKAWDMSKGELAFEVGVGEDSVATLAVSPDGKWVAAGSGYWSVKVFDAVTGIEVTRQPRTSSRNGLAWLDENRLIYPSDLGEVTAQPLSLLNIRTGEQTYIALNGFDDIKSFFWLPDGQRLVTDSSDGTISIWQARTGQRLEQFQFMVGSTPLSYFNPSSVSPNDGRLAASAEGSILLVDVTTRQIIRKLDYADTSSDTHIGQASWSKDGKRLAGLVYRIGQTTIAVWDAITGKLLLTIAVEIPEHIPSLALSPDGSRLALSWSAPGNARLVVWDVDMDIEAVSIGMPCSILRLFWLVEDQVVFSSPSGIETWDVNSSKQLRTVAWGTLFAISPDGRLAVTSEGKNGFTIREFNSGERLASLKTETVYILNVAFNPDGSLLASLSDYGSVTIWDMSEFYSH